MVVFTCIVCGTVLEAAESVFHLKDGRAIKGRKLGEVGERVMIRQTDGTRTIVEWRDIARVEQGQRTGPTEEKEKVACIYLGGPHTEKWLKIQYEKFRNKIHYEAEIQALLDTIVEKREERKYANNPDYVRHEGKWITRALKRALDGK